MPVELKKPELWEEEQEQEEEEEEEEEAFMPPK
jgi:hypothetical protein